MQIDLDLGLDLKNSTYNIKVAVPAPFEEGLDYLLPIILIEQVFFAEFSKIKLSDLIGLRVKAPLGRRTIIGVIIGIVSPNNITNSQYKLKEIIEVIDSKPIFSSYMQDLLHWMHVYYHAPIGMVYHTAWPVKIAKGALIKDVDDLDKVNSEIKSKNNINDLKLILSDEQKNAISEISSKLNKFFVHVLHGVTGSGKTEVYLRLMEDILSQGKSVLVMVPEINLTPQMQHRFEMRFSVPIICLHSKITPVRRFKYWQHMVLSGNENELQDKSRPYIIIGTRSSVFIPKDISLIIVDECHDQSYQQQSDLRYCAIQTALMRSKIADIPIVLGSATPSCEILRQVNLGNYYYWRLNKRVEAVHELKYNLIDLRGKKLKAGISAPLFDVIAEHLANKGQVFVFINRRGYAPLVLCNSCGWIPECTHCSSKLTYHQSQEKLMCHHCGRTKKISLRKDNCEKGEKGAKCEKCDSSKIVPVGVGTQRVEEVLKERFLDANILRIDANTTSKKGEFDRFLEQINSGDANIIVGTQMLAKGHHFPNLTLVAMLNLDDALFSSDFRAQERLGQLLVQVAGRAGRSQKAGEVYLQTHQPEHPCLRLLLEQRWDEFSEQVMHNRLAAEHPPYSFDAIWRAEGKSGPRVIQLLNNLRNLAQPYLDENLFCFGPAPALLIKKAGLQQYQLLMRSNTRKLLHSIIKHQRMHVKPISGVRMFLEVDPVCA